MPAADVGRMTPGTAMLLARSLKPAWLILSPVHLDDREHELPQAPAAVAE